MRVNPRAIRVSHPASASELIVRRAANQPRWVGDGAMREAGVDGERQKSTSIGPLSICHEL